MIFLLSGGFNDINSVQGKGRNWIMQDQGFMEFNIVKLGHAAALRPGLSDMRGKCVDIMKNCTFSQLNLYSMFKIFS